MRARGGAMVAGLRRRRPARAQRVRLHDATGQAHSVEPESERGRALLAAAEALLSAAERQNRA
jgi:hypothetical protein